jgi:uncharacterized protein YdaU (DUF1376 family)
MGTLKWYKRDPRAALIGMAGLSLTDCGAYNLVLDLIYIHDGRLPDNDREIAKVLHVDIRKWRRIRKRLMTKGKLYPYAGELHNERADIEVHESLKRIAIATDAANKRWAAYNEIKKLSDAEAMRGQCYLQPHKEKLSANIVPIAKRTPEKENKS